MVDSTMFLISFFLSNQLLYCAKRGASSTTKVATWELKELAAPVSYRLGRIDELHDDSECVIQFTIFTSFDVRMQ